MRQQPGEEHEPVIWSIGGAPEAEPDRDTEGLPNYDDLVRQYDEAVLKVSRLESQVDHLTRQLEGVVSPKEEAAVRIDPAHESQGLRELADWIEALQRLFAETPWKAPRSESGGPGLTASQATNMPSPIGEDELRNLRVQVAALAHQLAQSDNHPDEKNKRHRGGVRSGKSKRHRGGERSVLRKLAGRVGIR